MQKLLSIIFTLTLINAMEAKKNILVIDSSDPEKRDLLRSFLSKHYEFHFYDVKDKITNQSPARKNLDLTIALDEIKQNYKTSYFDGVFSSQDYVGALFASLVAQEFNLPGPTPQSILLCQHKYYCRCAQNKLVPFATPSFGLIDPNNFNESIAVLPFAFPFFVKPVKACFSWGSLKINSKEELEKNLLHLLPSMGFLKPFNDILQRYPEFQLPANYLLAEEILEGKQVTVEGFVCNKSIHIIGIVDSIMYPGTISFEHFEYPSLLPYTVQKRMGAIAKKFIKGIDLHDAFFNIEMMYNPKTGVISIIEVNPRMAAQFADLYEKVNGRSSYEIIGALVTRSPLPKLQKNKGGYAIAASFALRVFENGMVKKVPTEDEIARVYQLFPDARIHIHVQEGQKLSDVLQDGKSYLYAIINLGGENKQDLLARLERCKKMLPFAII